jgi:hypothetical protein
MMRRLTTFLTVLLLASPAFAADIRYPIFDAHVHYSEPAWAQNPPADILRKFDELGVIRALVSSTPDDGTLRLADFAPDRIAPELRPYHADVNSGNWTTNQAVPEYLAERLSVRKYHGIGEFHMQLPRQVGTPGIKAAIKLAIENKIVLHVHSGAPEVAALFAAEPRLRILWAHAGMDEDAVTVGQLMDQHQNLWADLSFRAWDVLVRDKLSPAWREVFRRHSDRFMIGSDTFVTARWDEYADIIGEHRRWLALLPEDLARSIAYRNAVHLFGDGGRAELKD